MAIVPIGGSCVEDKRPVNPYLVSPEALKESRKVKGLAGYMDLNGDIKLADGRRFPLPESDIQYPNWDRVLPEKGSKIAFTVALDAKLLFELARALGSDGAVTLRFIDELSPITVTPNRSFNGEHGVLMPMRVGG